MQADPEYLRQHYSSLSDEALLAIERSDLIEMAQQCYDAELSRRELDRPRARRASEPRAVPGPSDGLTGLGIEGEAEPSDPEASPAWLDEASEAYSVVVVSKIADEQVANAREVLEAAGIPCYLELTEIAEEECRTPPATHRWRLLVPGNLNLQAMSTLERDILNPEFETAWKAHLEALSDSELLATGPEETLCGLFDRVDRAMSAYHQEIARRRLKAKSR